MAGQPPGLLADLKGEAEGSKTLLLFALHRRLSRLDLPFLFLKIFWLADVPDGFGCLALRIYHREANGELSSLIHGGL